MPSFSFAGGSLRKQSENTHHAGEDQNDLNPYVKHPLLRQRQQRVEQAHEVVDHAVQLLVEHQAVQPGVDLQAFDLAGLLQR